MQFKVDNVDSFDMSESQICIRDRSESDKESKEDTIAINTDNDNISIGEGDYNDDLKLYNVKDLINIYENESKLNKNLRSSLNQNKQINNLKKYYNKKINSNTKINDYKLGSLLTRSENLLPKC